MLDQEFVAADEAALYDCWDRRIAVLVEAAASWPGVQAVPSPHFGRPAVELVLDPAGAGGGGPTAAELSAALRAGGDGCVVRDCNSGTPAAVITY